MAKWCHGLGCSVSEVGWELALEFHWPKLQDHVIKTDHIAYVHSYRRPAKAGKRVRPSGLQQTRAYSKLHIREAVRPLPPTPKKTSRVRFEVTAPLEFAPQRVLKP